MRIKMKKTMPVAVPTSDGPSGVRYLDKGQEYTVEDTLGASLIRGGEAVEVEDTQSHAPAEKAQEAPMEEAKPAPKKKAPKKKAPKTKDLGAAPENK